MMNVYTSNRFYGWWPVPVAAVVVANNAEQAKAMLIENLEALGLPQNAEQVKVEPLETDEPIVVILSDGEY